MRRHRYDGGPHNARKGLLVRYAILMTVLTCAACAALGGYLQHDESSAAEGATAAVVMQPPTTEAEFAAARAARLCAEQEQRELQGAVRTAAAAPAGPLICSVTIDERQRYAFAEH